MRRNNRKQQQRFRPPIPVIIVPNKEVGAKTIFLGDEQGRSPKVTLETRSKGDCATKVGYQRLWKTGNTPLWIQGAAAMLTGSLCVALVFFAMGSIQNLTTSGKLITGSNDLGNKELVIDSEKLVKLAGEHDERTELDKGMSVPKNISKQEQTTSPSGNQMSDIKSEMSLFTETNQTTVASLAPDFVYVEQIQDKKERGSTLGIIVEAFQVLDER